MSAPILLLTRKAGLRDPVSTSSPFDMPKGLGRGYFFPAVPPADARSARKNIFHPH
jgi:hypothetical protein